MRATEELFEYSLNDVLTDISLDAMEEEVRELIDIEAWIDEAEDICQIFSDEKFGIMYEDVVLKDSVARKERRRRIKEVNKRQREVSGGMVKTFGSVTSIGGNIIFAGYNLIMKLVTLVTKVVKGMSDKLIALPNALGGFIDKMGRALPNVKNKIKGHLAIYIRPENIKEFYEDNLFVICDSIINNALVMASGDAWVTRIKNFELSDVQLARRINRDVAKLDNFSFSEVSINMNDTNNVEKYFGNTPYIEIKTKPAPGSGLDPTKKKYTYFQALQRVSLDLQSYQNNIKKISNSLDKKLMATQSNQQFGRLPEKKQNLIKESVQLVSKSIVKIERIGKYIIRDINTVHKFIQGCIENTKNTPHKDKIRKNVNDDIDAYRIKDPDKPGDKPTGRGKEGRKARREWRKNMRVYKARKSKEIDEGGQRWDDLEYIDEPDN